MYRSATITASLLSFILLLVLCGVFSKVGFAILILPIYLIGWVSMGLLALLNRYTVCVKFSKGFIVLTAVATLVMLWAHSLLQDDSMTLLFREGWPVYGVFFAAHIGAFLLTLYRSRTL